MELMEENPRLWNQVVKGIPPLMQNNFEEETTEEIRSLHKKMFLL